MHESAIRDIILSELRDTRGAAKALAERLGKEKNIYKSVSPDSIHALVRANMLRAYIFDEHGILQERPPLHPHRSGQALYFLMSDLNKAPLPHKKPGRPSTKSEE